MKRWFALYFIDEGELTRISKFYNNEEEVHTYARSLHLFEDGWRRYTNRAHSYFYLVQER